MVEDAAVVGVDIVIIEKQAFLHCLYFEKSQHLRYSCVCVATGPGWGFRASHTSFEARDRGRDLDSAGQQVREPGEDSEEDKSQGGRAGKDAGFAS